MLAATAAMLAVGAGSGMLLGGWTYPSTRELAAYVLWRSLIAVHQGLLWTALALGVAGAVQRALGWYRSRGSFISFTTLLLMFGVAGEFVRRFMEFALFGLLELMVLQMSVLLVWALVAVSGYACFALLAIRALLPVARPQGARLSALLVATSALALLVERTCWFWWARYIHKPIAEFLGLWGA